MPTSRRILIYGNTLALAGIALALERRPDFSVQMIDAESATIMQQIETYSPHVIIFDSSQTNAESILNRLEQSPDVLAIGIAANSDRMLLWRGQSLRALTTEDLIHVIQNYRGEKHRRRQVT